MESQRDPEPEHAFHCSVFNFAPRLFATLGGQAVRPGFGGWGGAAEVFLRLAHGSHPGFEHDPPGAAFRAAHRGAGLHAEFCTQRSGYENTDSAIYFAFVAGSGFARCSHFGAF